MTATLGQIGGDSETALLQALRDAIRQECGYQPEQCEVEFDALVPANCGEVYVAVIPGGWRPGPSTDGNGGVLDELIDVDVEVVIRMAGVPRDRKREVFLSTLGGLNNRLWQIVTTVGHFDYRVITAAKGYSAASSAGFIVPLKFGGMEQLPRSVSSDYFKARAGEEAAGLARKVFFRGARRLQYRATMA